LLTTGVPANSLFGRRNWLWPGHSAAVQVEGRVPRPHLQQFFGGAVSVRVGHSRRTVQLHFLAVQSGGKLGGHFHGGQRGAPQNLPPHPPEVDTHLHRPQLARGADHVRSYSLTPFSRLTLFFINLHFSQQFAKFILLMNKVMRFIVDFLNSQIVGFSLIFSTKKNGGLWFVKDLLKGKFHDSRQNTGQLAIINHL